MKRHLFGNLLAVNMLLLSGCSSGFDSSDTVSPPRLEKKQKVEFFQAKPEVVDFFDQMITAFERENPEIDIEQVNVPDGMEVLKTRIARGDIPDMFITYPIEQDYVFRAQNGYLLDLTKEDFIQLIEPQIQNRYLVDGKMYGAALSQNAVGVLYNKDIFAELHLDIPETWNEFLNVLEKVKSAGKTPLLMPNNNLESISVFNLNLVANEFDDEYWTRLNQGEVKLSGNKKWEEVAKKMLQIVQYAQANSLNAVQEEVQRAFANGEGAMYITGTWELPVFEKLNPSLNYGMFPFPATNDPDQNRVLGGVDGGFAIAAETKYPKAAKRFLKYLVQNAQKYSDYEGGISAVKGVLMNKEQVKPLYSLVRQGNAVNWPNHYWIGGTGAEEDFRKYSQQFFIDQDIDAYLAHLDSMFEKYREMNS